jgi:aspartyl-tRNA(Asn)/glutamyl-tRNA(Gln) amidotransferase subunit C
MSISPKEVERIAKLARLSFKAEEKQKLQTELSEILNYIDQLKEVQGKVSESYNPEALNLMRDDVSEPSTIAERLIKQAPSNQDNFVKVKSILE